MATRIPAYRQAQADIKRYIEAHRLAAGDPLPPEAALAEHIGVSRPSLREGMKALEALGVVETRHGEGVFVSAFSFNAILENLPYYVVADGKSLRNLLQVQSVIELGVIADVVDKISIDDLQRLRDLAHRMLAAAAAGQSSEIEGGEFHTALYRCLDNTFLSQLVELFWQVFRRLNAHRIDVVDHWAPELTARHHLDIVEMIARGDKTGVVAAMRRHFEGIVARLDSCGRQ